ncbi:uncharacterized protein FMAN_12268 [Fusarium mangiferae]|uniref:Uncharacterized protein n=1 Tax=Fusarium mangiferae TaxID=192010 RepID=A0A1L7TPW5_FUSMA|nr:uncharacterized protein FMAN_12268 [Fusarium mangiferae]CVK98213.1 uncharacterized protein FMAN_12268 [Fusarium mangiferae]
MSGALIQIDLERKARFVHVSVLEYLTDRSRQDQSQESMSTLAKEQSLAQRSCASCCLAYLLYGIPAEPLGGGPQVVADRDLQNIRYASLEYSAQFWDFHFSEFLLKLPSVMSQECELSIKLASDFVSAKRTLMGSGSGTAWIAGAVVPSVLFAALPVAFAIWWRKRRSRTPKTPKSPHLEDEAGTAGFGKPELDSQGIPRQRSKEETITNKSTALHDIVIFAVPAEMPDYGSNRAELQGEAKVSFRYSS